MSRILHALLESPSAPSVAPSSDPRDLYKSIILTQSLPNSFRRDRESVNAKKLACFGESDNLIGGLFGKANFYGETALPADGQDRSAIQQARDTMFWDSASGKYLTSLGADLGVSRPPQSPFDDTLFRTVGQILGWLPKTPLLVMYRLAEAIFGTQASLLVLNGRSWQIYEVNPNEIIFECPIELIAGTVSTASYLHGYAGVTGLIAGPTNTITVAGTDARLSISGGNLFGLATYVFFAGVWNSYTIASSSFAAGVNTIVLSAATVPSGDSFPMFIDIPGSSSFSGDFMLADATVPGDGLGPPVAQLVHLYGQGRLDILTYYVNNFVRAAGVTLRTEVL